MSYNYVENYTFDRSGTRIRPAWKGLGLVTGIPSAGDFSNQTGIPLDIAKKFLEKVWTGDPELQNIVKEMYDKYVPDSKKADMQKWLTAVGVKLPIESPATPEAGRADVTSEPIAPKESKMKMLIPVAIIGIAAFMMMRKR